MHTHTSYTHAHTHHTHMHTHIIHTHTHTHTCMHTHTHAQHTHTHIHTHMCTCIAHTHTRHAKVERLKCLSHERGCSCSVWGGGGGGVDCFTHINNMAYVYLLFYSPHFQAFFANIGPVLAKLKWRVLCVLEWALLACKNFITHTVLGYGHLRSPDCVFTSLQAMKESQ